MTNVDQAHAEAGRADRTPKTGAPPGPLGRLGD